MLASCISGFSSTAVCVACLVEFDFSSKLAVVFWCAVLVDLSDCVHCPNGVVCVSLFTIVVSKFTGEGFTECWIRLMQQL